MTGLFNWWRGEDLNFRPSGYEPDELPDCSTPRCKKNHTSLCDDNENFVCVMGPLIRLQLPNRSLAFSGELFHQAPLVLTA